MPISNEDLLPVCENISKRFIKQGLKKLGGSREDVLAELTNVSYVNSKNLQNTRGLKTWIIWKLCEYLANNKASLTDMRRKYNEEIKSPLEIAQANEQKEMLLLAVKKMDAVKLNMLSLRYKDGLTYSNIGNIYGFSRVTIANNIKNSLDEIRILMKVNDES